VQGLGRHVARKSREARRLTRGRTGASAACDLRVGDFHRRGVNFLGPRLDFLTSRFDFFTVYGEFLTAPGYLPRVRVDFFDVSGDFARARGNLPLVRIDFVAVRLNFWNVGVDFPGARVVSRARASISRV
jgi:hypothetical protein